MSESEFTRMLRLKREERLKKYTESNDPGLSSLDRKSSLITTVSASIGHESPGKTRAPTCDGE